MAYPGHSQLKSEQLKHTFREIKLLVLLKEITVHKNPTLLLWLLIDALVMH
jgi:hypothetical protein